MKLFKKEQIKGKGIEKIVKETFCELKTIVSCGYYNEPWCPKTCGFYERKLNDAKYWTR